MSFVSIMIFSLVLLFAKKNQKNRPRDSKIHIRHQKAVHPDICQSHFGTDGLVLFYTFQIPSLHVTQPLHG